MNIFYGFAFLVLIYYVIYWRRNLYKKNMSLHLERNSILNKNELFNDINLLSHLRIPDTAKRTLCNVQWIPSYYSGLYNSEDEDNIFNYATLI